MAQTNLRIITNSVGLNITNATRLFKIDFANKFISITV